MSPQQRRKPSLQKKKDFDENDVETAEKAGDEE